MLGLLVLAMTLAAPVVAAEVQQRSAATSPAPDVGPSPMFRMSGRMVGGNPFASRLTRDAPFPAVLSMRGTSSRVDFEGPRGERGLLLQDSASGRGWIADLSRGVSMETASAGLADLVVDPERPCAHLPFTCQPASSRVVAGAQRRGWRYRDADGRGPAGTSNGEFWIDAANGVMVAYRGRMRGLADLYTFEADTVAFEPQAAVLFELPEVVQARGKAPSR